MKIAVVDAAVLRAAVEGDLPSIDAILVTIQPGVHNLAVRMLGNRDDASDATQEILLKVVTHLAGFRGEAAFGTWVFQVARNHLLTAATRSKESPEVSLDGMAERLRAGLDYAAAFGELPGADRALTPEDRLAARQVALGCTQNMLMTLDREQRLSYVLDTVFGLASLQAAQVIGVTAATHRQRLSRARRSLEPFMQRTCGLVNVQADCRCERQLPALRALANAESARAPTSATAPPRAPALAALHRVEQAETERQFGALVRMSDAAAVFRAHPDYRAPERLIAAIRSVLRSEGYAVGPPPALQ
jgi:RNA polymerase sigma factor (sigma-70 family)